MSGTCGGCQFLVEPQWERCKFCGHDLSAPPPPPPSPLTGSSAPGFTPLPPARGANGSTGAPSPHLSPRTSKKKPILLGVAGVVVLYVIAASFLASEPATTTNRHGVEVMSAHSLSTVCEGKGGAGTSAPYEANSDHHPVQVAVNDGDSWNRRNPPYASSGFQGEAADEIELVACIEAAPNPPIERCRFEDGTFVAPIEFPSVEVDVREASTGEVLDSSFIRPESRDCPFGVMVQDGESMTKRMLPTHEIDEYLLEFTDPD